MNIELATLSDLEMLKTEIIEELNRLQKKKEDLSIWMRSTEVKKMLSISDSQLQTYRNNGTIPYTKFGTTIFYNRDDITKILMENMSNKDW